MILPLTKYSTPFSTNLKLWAGESVAPVKTRFDFHVA